ncbi:uncharacterized protein LOC112345520 [Selaginella moellendorffii]|uniref:uncharacterized protein LOC112345520 n=1 Tax=Selaginella moellendorffii TaxID=88036 RepID=UPI000D1D1158|nr:uncharacterized protein LOC112345520 [Selaginella moellendorffii]|eukprot:XP_024528182.1 uncharacterized protein LOC112345520 [Selaginella moellendorffii]
MIPSRRSMDPRQQQACSCHSCVTKHEYRGKSHKFFCEAGGAAAESGHWSGCGGGGMLFPATPLKREMTLRRDIAVESPPCSTGDRASLWRWPCSMPRYRPENQIVLHKWFLIKLEESDTTSGRLQVALGGFQYGMDSEFVKTGPIAKRTDKSRLKTCDGVEVRLMGSMDEETTIANGFSAWVADIFYSGFPCTWERVLQDDTEVSRMTKKVGDTKRSLGGSSPCSSKGAAASESQAASPTTETQVVSKEPSVETKTTVAHGDTEPIIVVTEVQNEVATVAEITCKEPVAESEADVAAEAIVEELFGTEREQDVGTETRERTVAELTLKQAGAGSPEHTVAAEVHEGPGSEKPPSPKPRDTIEARAESVVENNDTTAEQRKSIKPSPARGRKRPLSKPSGKRGRPRKNKLPQEEAEAPPPPPVDSGEPSSIEEDKEAREQTEQPGSEFLATPQEVGQDSMKQQVVSGTNNQIEAGASTAQSKRTKRRPKRSSNVPPPLPASRVKQDEVIEAYGLKTSRSGRLLVPPLAYWRNQTIAHDKDGGIIAILDGFKETPSDTGCFNFKPPTEKRQLQQKLCSAAWDVTEKGKKKARK